MAIGEQWWTSMATHRISFIVFYIILHLYIYLSILFSFLQLMDTISPQMIQRQGFLSPISLAAQNSVSLSKSAGRRWLSATRRRKLVVSTSWTWEYHQEKWVRTENSPIIGWWQKRLVVKKDVSSMCNLFHPFKKMVRVRDWWGRPIFVGGHHLASYCALVSFNEHWNLQLSFETARIWLVSLWLNLN